MLPTWRLVVHLLLQLIQTLIDVFIDLPNDPLLIELEDDCRRWLALLLIAMARMMPRTVAMKLMKEYH